MRTLPILSSGATALAALVLLAAPAAAAPFARIPLEAAADQGDDLYRVQPGDTLRSIANRYLFRASDYGVLVERNRVPNGNRLAVGSAITIPRRLLMVVPARAIVTAFRGAVTIGADQPARIGAVIAEGARIETGANSSASLRLEDGSTISLPSQSVIHIDRLRLVLASGELQQIFRLDTGRSQYVVAPNRGPASRFEVRTPVSVSAVRGTEFRVSFDRSDSAGRAEVLKDNVAVTAAGASVMLPQGYGAKSSAASAGQAVPLLPPPTVQLPIVHKPDGSLAFTLAPIEKAVRYRLQVANDARFQDMRDEVVSDTPAITLPTSPVGSYFIRVTAIDANGLEGLPHVYPFTYNPK